MRYIAYIPLVFWVCILATCVYGDTLEMLDAKGDVVGMMRWPVERDRPTEPYNDPRGFVVEPLPDREETLVKLKRVKSYERNADGSWKLLDAKGEVVMVMPPLNGWQRLAQSAFK